MSASNHRAPVIWFTGLPCSGKTTLSDLLAADLRSVGFKVEQLDGDRVRSNGNAGLGFTRQGRMKNVMSVSEKASQLTKEGAVVLVSLISPYRDMRQYARTSAEDFVEVYLRCPLAVCESRDVKGMYRLAREGKVTNFTGISDPYEEPLDPEIVLDTDRWTARECIQKMKEYFMFSGRRCMMLLGQQ